MDLIKLSLTDNVNQHIINYIHGGHYRLQRLCLAVISMGP